MTKRATGDLPDLSQCEQEPIHIPGAIQPHGVLLGIRPDTLTISQVSENVGDWLGLGPDEVLGRPLEEVAGAAAAEAIRAGGTSALRLIGPDCRALDGSVHRPEGLAILEVEAAAADPDPGFPTPGWPR